MLWKADRDARDEDHDRVPDLTIRVSAVGLVSQWVRSVGWLDEKAHVMLCKSTSNRKLVCDAAVQPAARITLFGKGRPLRFDVPVHDRVDGFVLA